MSLASAFTLIRLSADLTYELSKAPEVPKEISVQCAISRGKMMVLLESPHMDTVPESYVFAQAESSIRHRLEIDGLPVEANHLGANGEPIAIKVFLKLQSAAKPSAAHRFNWLLQDSSGSMLEDDPLDDPLDDRMYEPLLTQAPEVMLDRGMPDRGTFDRAKLDRVKPSSLFGAEDDDDITGVLSEDDDVTGVLSEEEFISGEQFLSHEEFLFSGELPLEEDLGNFPAGEAATTDELLNLDGLYGETSDDMATSVSMAEEAFSQEEEEQPQGAGGRLGLMVAGLGLAAVFGTLGYGLSRPCVIGGCDRIQRAQDLGDAALIALGEKPSPQTVLDMGQQLNIAVDTLKPIPAWSPHHSRSQELLANYQGEADLLNVVAAAQENALAAANESQNPPHPIAHWEAIAQRWQKTISQLEKLPSGSPIHASFVTPKLQEYRGNLAAIKQRVVAEQKAEANLNQAQLTASMAKDQAEVANTLAAWKTALTSWDKAVTQLKQIPGGTMAYGETRKLLPKYETDLGEVRTRYQQEQAADQFYNEAVRHAATARQYETEDQWTLAMVSWRDAITQIKGVPDGTSRYTDSQNLLKTYEPALATAQENLRLAIRFRKAEENFGRICRPTFCQFGLKGGSVQIKLAKDYDALADFSITDPNNRPSSIPASAQMIVEVNMLLQEVINIGKRTQLPIELYGSDGGFIARFSPELEGYVKTVVVR
ncbi:hypothetical protein [Leptothoe sp. PORK10 BA2]|uniref:hypothetical protein n=1 Tax=Leptothoe sp. PORK10 BA2 TaxID=3110254 RepID=UPI002B2005C1|nr:hypothetical protein [Leptothoe sp. PORK10 BA2]MEA5464354.1 hypothetical protein [Leptothoe sp. PORK10 BA2]